MTLKEDFILFVFFHYPIFKENKELERLQKGGTRKSFEPPLLTHYGFPPFFNEKSTTGPTRRKYHVAIIAGQFDYCLSKREQNANRSVASVYTKPYL